MSQKLDKIIETDKEFLFQNYGNRLPVCFTKAENSCLYDQDGNKYIDFLSGIAVNTLGYADEEFKQTLKNQIDSIIHSSNWFFNAEQIKAAELISDISFPGRTLFVNSGTEANEAAIKLSRLYGLSQSENKYEIVSFTNSFHGRTFGAMTATAQNKIHSGFGPLPEGFHYLNFGDIDAFKNVISKNTVCAVILEPIQGEGGILIPDKQYLSEIVNLCKSNNILIITDEIQTGIGRTGKFFGYQHFDFIPDIISMAKGLGSGIPVGAIHCSTNLSNYLAAGKHGTTFGGNHLACTAASYTIKKLKDPSFLNNVNQISEQLFSKLNDISKKYSFVKEVRGLGLHIGIELTIPGMEFVKTALANGLIINCTADKVLRIMPPLTISSEEVNAGLEILDQVFRSYNETI